MIVGWALGWYIQAKIKLITPPPANAFGARQRHAQPRIAVSASGYRRARRAGATCRIAAALGRRFCRVSGRTGRRFNESEAPPRYQLVHCLFRLHRQRRNKLSPIHQEGHQWLLGYSDRTAGRRRRTVHLSSGVVTAVVVEWIARRNAFRFFGLIYRSLWGSGGMSAQKAPHLGRESS
jgi:hypothetical protein